MFFFKYCIEFMKTMHALKQNLGKFLKQNLENSLKQSFGKSLMQNLGKIFKAESLKEIFKNSRILESL